MTRSYFSTLIVGLPLLLAGQTALTQAESGQRQARILVTNALVVDGSGTPANGPRTIVIEGNRIVSVTPGSGRPLAGDKVIDVLRIPEAQEQA